MTKSIDERLTDLGVSLPVPPRAVASYLPAVLTGNLLFTSGQLPLKEGALVATGLVGGGVSVEDAQDAAKWCAANVLAQARATIGDLERIARLVKITVFVASAPGFDGQHLVANGASDFFVAALGEKGAHARSAVGMAGLPLNATVEVEAILEVS